MEELNTAIWQALSGILIALIGLVYRMVKQWLDSKGITEQIVSKEYIVRWIVNGIQQAYQNEDGETKLRLAKQEAVKFFNGYGFMIDEAEINRLIEAIVFEVKEVAKEESNKEQTEQTQLDLGYEEFVDYLDSINDK